MLGAKTVIGLGVGIGFIPAASTIVLGMHYHTLASGWALAGCTIGFSSLLLVSGLAYRRSRAQKQDPNIQFDGENSSYEQAERMGHNAKKCVILASAGLAACFVSGAVFGLLNPVAFSQTLSGMFLLSTGVAETALSAGQVAGLDIGVLVLAAVITVTCLAFMRRRMKNAATSFPDETARILNADDYGNATQHTTFTTTGNTQREPEQPSNSTVGNGGGSRNHGNMYIPPNPPRYVREITGNGRCIIRDANNPAATVWQDTPATRVALGIEQQGHSGRGVGQSPEQ